MQLDRHMSALRTTCGKDAEPRCPPLAASSWEFPIPSLKAIPIGKLGQGVVCRIKLHSMMLPSISARRQEFQDFLHCPCFINYQRTAFT